MHGAHHPRQISRRRREHRSRTQMDQVAGVSSTRSKILTYMPRCCCRLRCCQNLSFNHRPNPNTVPINLPFIFVPNTHGLDDEDRTGQTFPFKKQNEMTRIQSHFSLLLPLLSLTDQQITLTDRQIDDHFFCSYQGLNFSVGSPIGSSPVDRVHRRRKKKQQARRRENHRQF